MASMYFADKTLSISRNPLDGQKRTSSFQSACGCVEITTKLDFVLFFLTCSVRHCLFLIYSFLGSVGKNAMKCTSILEDFCMPPGCNPCRKMFDKLFISVMWKIPETYEDIPWGTVAARLSGSKISMLLWPLAARIA